MYRLKMASSRRILLLLAAVLCLAGLAACGSDSDIESAAAITVADTDDDQSDQSAEPTTETDDDHDDEDHDDEDHDEHGDGDKDHDDHDDEDHDEDEDHDDHDEDEDHDEHGDDHGDEDKHDEHEDHDDENSSGLGAHVHGEAELSVAWSEGDVVIDLISPTDNIFGFEYEPSTDEDIALAAERTQALTTPGVLVFNSEAGCNLTDEPTTDVVFEGSHAEITASWFFVCDNPDEIASLDTASLFAEFPGLVDVDAQWASATGQSAAELSASSTVLRLG